MKKFLFLLPTLIIYHFYFVFSSGVLISSSNLNLIEGDLLVERTDNHDVTFSVTLQFSDESTDIYGSDLWQATIFTNTRMDCGETPCTSSQPIVLSGGNVTRGDMVTTESAVASLDMSQCTCPQMQYLCVLITMNPGASVNFTLESPMQGFRDWHEVTCTGEATSQSLAIMPKCTFFTIICHVRIQD